MLTSNYYNDFFEFGQQKMNFSFFELSLPDDDPVYTLKKVMEDLDFSGLLANCSDKGRTGYNPIMMYAVVTYANMRGVRSVDRIVELCERDLAFIWLTRGQKPKRDAFYEFKGKKLTSEILDDLNYQFLRRLQKEGLVTLKELFIDGTKIEANANRYTFVWRGTINYHLAGLLDSIELTFTRYNTFLQENGYIQTFEVYGCADCSGCEHKARCLYKYNAEKDAEKNKVMKINEQWEELREKSHANIQSERGILKRQTRSIQTEGHFGDIKENENFRRFNYRSADKVYKEFMLYAIGRNINKYCRFLNEKLKKFEGKTTERTA